MGGARLPDNIALQGGDMARHGATPRVLDSQTLLPEWHKLGTLSTSSLGRVRITLMGWVRGIERGREGQRVMVVYGVATEQTREHKLVASVPAQNSSRSGY